MCTSFQNGCLGVQYFLKKVKQKKILITLRKYLIQNNLSI